MLLHAQDLTERGNTFQSMHLRRRIQNKNRSRFGLISCIHCMSSMRKFYADCTFWVAVAIIQRKYHSSNHLLVIWERVPPKWRKNCSLIRSNSAVLFATRQHLYLYMQIFIFCNIIRWKRLVMYKALVSLPSFHLGGKCKWNADRFYT